MARTLVDIGGGVLLFTDELSQNDDGIDARLDHHVSGLVKHSGFL